MIFNFDACFFEVHAPENPKLTGAIVSKDVLSLSITEELGNLDSGTIALHDDHHIYSRFFRPGLLLEIAFGIKILGKEIKRTGMRFMVSSPSGGGGSNGDIFFNCSLTAACRGSVHKKSFTAGTKESVISEVMLNLGVSTQDLNFRGMKDTITANTEIVQNESDLRFLTRLADSWGCAFRIGCNQKGQLVGMFVDYDKTKEASLAVTGRNLLKLEYGSGGKIEDANIAYPINGGGGPNVLSYTWKDNAMNSATGDGVTLTEMPDGTVQVTRYSVPDEKVLTYRLVPERIERELAEAGDITRSTAVLLEMLSKKDWEQIRFYFDEIAESTAPQGSGIEVEVKLIGDPLITTGMVCGFGAGFPDRIGAADRTWYVSKVTHSLSSGGFTTDISIRDAYSFNEEGVKLPLAIGGAVE
jgi:hypothetical protein